MLSKRLGLAKGEVALQKKIIEKNGRGGNYYFLGLLQVIILFFLLLNYVFHDFAFLDIVKVFLYQFFGWFVVGYASFRILKIPVNNFADVIALSYGLGAIAALITYLIFMTLGAGGLLPFVTIAESVLSIVYLYKTGAKIEEYHAETFSMIWCLCLLFAFYFLSLSAVSFVNTLPNEIGGGTGYYVDWPFWAGNNIAFTKTFPSDSFRQIGIPFGYHYFSSILMAEISLSTGVDINIITFYFSSVFAGLIYILSGYYFSARVLKRKAFIAILMCAVLFTDGTSLATQTWHVLICPFGFDWGYAYGMFALAVLAEILVNNRFKEFFMPSILFIAMTTGCKGPVGVVVLAAYGIGAIFLLFRKKIKSGLIGGGAWLLSFLIVYYVFILDTWVTGDQAGLEYIGGLGIHTILTKGRGVSDLYNSIISAYRITGDHFLIKMYSVWLFIYRSNKVVITLLLISIVAIIIDFFRKKAEALLYGLVFSSFIGILLFIYTTQSGSSQMYFIMSMYPAGSLAGMYVIEKMGSIKASTICNYLRKCLIIITLLSLGISMNQFYNTVMPKFREGVAVIRGTYTSNDYEAYYMDSTDYEIFEWLKENTANDCVFAMDSFTDSYGRENPMLAGVFSERYVWNEVKYVYDLTEASRRNTIVQALQIDTESSIEQIKSEGVDYIVYRVSADKKELGMLTDNLKEVFRNEHYIIYEL